ncbi:HET-domain-containing protein [Coniochaeta ligniaria NRRL 30616]|uniref:HET-domain-containing protein n=1 Tax=Coniochaeta ligniaria NRRL 30616 TaxID=1408157 RepID=A0A1J7J462_9PEZI|nr:HET-domain-containing protein [Coniochaeta ligniaria NRRL 30616]
MTANSYAYQPLSAPDSIRIVILDPAEGHNDHLLGTLLHTTLGDCDYELIEPYTALSYVWGDSTQTGTIYISGQAVTITATLASALRHLRDATRPRRVWADALCIDQSNIPERNRQVTLMGMIYRVAAHTVVYLGPSTRASDLVLEDYPSLDQDRRGAIVHAAKLDILTRPWFCRVWIFQELILSRDPWVQCGQRRTRWADLCGLLIYNTPGLSGKGDEKLRMLDSMNRSRQGSATDARDFVFAHMGIASDRLNVGDAVPVNYDMPLGRVFARMSIVETLVSLLDQQPEGAGARSMPSWAVDWSVAPLAYAPMYFDDILGLVGHSIGVIKNLSVRLPMSATLDLKGMAIYQDTVAQISVYHTGDLVGRHARQEHKKLCEALKPEPTDVPQEHASFLRYFHAWTQEQTVKPHLLRIILDGRRLATTLTGNLGVVPAQVQEVSLILRPVNVSNKDATELQSIRVRPATTEAEVGPETWYMSGVSSTTDAFPVQHYVLVGSCCFDGQIPWTVAQLPDEDEMIIYALHSGSSFAFL